MGMLHISLNDAPKATRSLSEDKPIELIGDIIPDIKAIEEATLINFNFQITNNRLTLTLSKGYENIYGNGIVQLHPIGILEFEMCKISLLDNIGIVFENTVLSRSSKLLTATGVFKNFGEEIYGRINSGKAIDIWFFDCKEENQYIVGFYVNAICRDKLTFHLQPIIPVTD